MVKTRRNEVDHHDCDITMFKKSNVLIQLMLAPMLIIVASMLFDKSNIRSEGKYNLGHKSILFFEDKENSLSVAEVLNQRFDSLPNGSEDPNFGFNKSNIWLKLKLDPHNISLNTEIMQVGNPLLNTLELYEITENGPVLMTRTGDNYAFAKRPIEHRNYRIPIKINPERTTEYIALINSGGEQLLAPISLWSKEALESNDYRDNLYRGIYFGLIGFVLLFTLFLFLRLREKSSLYYVNYNMNLMLLQAALSGYTFQFIWPESPYLANVSTPLFASLSIWALLRFAQNFLELAKHYERINKVFSAVGYIVLANAALSLIPNTAAFMTSVITINVIALLLNFAIIPVAVGVLKKGFKPAKFFLIGFITLVFTVFGFIATNLGIIKSEFYAEYGLLIGSAVEVILLSFAVVDRFRSFKEQAIESLKELNKLEREQNETLEKTVVERTQEIYRQKTELEIQKEEIISSIRYAEKIQKNLLPSENEINSEFPDSFVYYQPKDIVSGDFYWIGKSRWNGVSSPAHDIALIAAGDCTGHGVPGAMVSVLGCNLLRESLQQQPEAVPGELLQFIDTRLKQTMSMHEGMNASDGMDMVLCAHQKDTNELHIAGANNHALIWDGEEFQTVRGSARPIGGHAHQASITFETKTVQLQPGNVVYLFTDGIADQFGGEKNKKLKTSGVTSFLRTIINEPMLEQKEKLHQFFYTWKGETEQTDDVCVIGFRV